MFASRAWIATAAVGVLAYAGPSAAEEIEITVVAAPPPAVTFVGVFKDVTSVRINERLKAEGHNLQIKWNHAYAQTLAKFPEVLEAVEAGIGGAGLILKNFEPSSLPMETYPDHMPFTGVSDNDILEIDAALRKKIPELSGTYEKYNQVFIRSGVSSSMQFFSTFPIAKYADLKGKKVGASGTFANWLRNSGAVAVNSSMLDSFTSIKNGVYDGYPISEPLAFVYKTWSAAPYFTKVDFGPTPTQAITFNLDTWKKLPEYAQKIILEEGKTWAEETQRQDDAKLHKFTAIMTKGGLKTTVLPPEERKKWAFTLPNIAKEWAKRLDGNGLPGTKLMNAYMAEVRARGLKPMRDWDKE